VTNAEDLKPVEALGKVFYLNNQYWFQALGEDTKVRLLDPHPERSAGFPSNMRSLTWGIWGLGLKDAEGIRLKSYRLGQCMTIKAPVVFMGNSWWLFHRENWLLVLFLNVDRKSYLSPLIGENLDASLRARRHPMVEVEGLLDLNDTCFCVHKVIITPGEEIRVPAAPDLATLNSVHGDILT
jgi:hypothetical protein